MSDSKNGPIPPNIYLTLKTWQEQRKTGQIALNISEGRVLNADVKEKITAQ